MLTMVPAGLLWAFFPPPYVIVPGAALARADPRGRGRGRVRRDRCRAHAARRGHRVRRACGISTPQRRSLNTEDRSHWSTGRIHARTAFARPEILDEGSYPSRGLCDAASSPLRRHAEDAAARRRRSDPAPDDHEPAALWLRPVRDRHRLPRAHGSRRGRELVPDPRRHVRVEPGLPQHEQRVLAAALPAARRERWLHPARRRRRVRPRSRSKSSSSAAPIASRSARSARLASKRSRSPPTITTACSRSASTSPCARRWASRSASSCSRPRRRKQLFAALARPRPRSRASSTSTTRPAFQQIIDEGATLYGVDIGSMYATEIDTIDDLLAANARLAQRPLRRPRRRGPPSGLASKTSHTAVKS